MKNRYDTTGKRQSSAERRPNSLLRLQRLKRNWTQVYVATMIGTSDVEVSRWENGTVVPMLFFREKLCALFSKTPEELGFVPAFEEINSPYPLSVVEKQDTGFSEYRKPRNEQAS